MAARPTYSKYDEWRDHGFPYDVGVAMLRELRVYPAFANLAALRHNPTNAEKLRVYLERFLKDKPGTPPAAIPQVGEGPQMAPMAQMDAAAPETAPIPAEPAPAQEPRTPSEVWRLRTMPEQQAVATLPPKPEELVPLYSTSALKAVPFPNLPEELKPGRIKNIEMSTERERQHAALLPVPAAAQCIHFRDMLRLMEQKDAEGRPVPFNLKRFTFNRKTRMGGELLHVHQAVLHTEASQANPRPYVERQASRAAAAKNPSARHKPGEHWKNATRNLQMPDGSIDKCIIWLIVEINGLRVVMGRNPVPDAQDLDSRERCRRIVELSDAINAQWDAERLWAEKGQLPFVPANLEQQLRAYTDQQLDQHEDNRVGPALYRANKALRMAEGEVREMWLRKQNEALQTRGIIQRIRAERAAAATEAVQQVHLKHERKKERSNRHKAKKRKAKKRHR